MISLISIKIKAYLNYFLFKHTYLNKLIYQQVVFETFCYLSQGCVLDNDLFYKSYIK